MQSINHSTIDFDNLQKEIEQGQDNSNNILAHMNALGYKYSDYLQNKTQNELISEYKLTSAQGYWLRYGAQTATISIPEEQNINFIERVTFHPNYSYAQFVGTYKPVQDRTNPEQIIYEFVPGPFLRTYVNAKKNPDKNFLLLIEEINRANVAAVFGDIFQLLDRLEDGTSEYPINISEDVKSYLSKKGLVEDTLSLPSNMYIWATMNSADQGVFPMDTAFKRRWDFEYIGIDENEEEIKDYVIPCGKEEYYWNTLRKAINTKLIELNINEDKLLGPFFLSKNILQKASDKNYRDEFIKLFKSKVIMYLFEDAAKMKQKSFFKLPSDKSFTYSNICKEFEDNGLGIFNFSEKIPNISEEDIERSKNNHPSSTESPEGEPSEEEK